MTINAIKHGYCSAIGVIGGILVTLWGDWNVALTILSCAMLVDIVTGLLVACIFGESPKSLYGGLSSKTFWRGIVKKIATFVVIWVGHGLDIMLNVDYIRNAAIVAFIAAEFISILENCAIMGVPIPEFLLKMIDVLKGENNNSQPTSAEVEEEENCPVTVYAYAEYENGDPVGDPIHPEHLPEDKK